MLNPLNFISRIFKSSNQKELDNLGKIIKKINALEKKVSMLDEKDFPIKTLELKEKLNRFLIFLLTIVIDLSLT